MSRRDIEKITQDNRISQILTAIQSYVIGGKLRPGTQLPSEKQLSGQLGVSRFSLREALRVAEAQGLIEIAQGKRPVVASPSAFHATAVMSIALKRSQENLIDLIVARSGLECKMVRVAARRITDKELRALEENVKLMEISGRELEYYVTKDIEFHDIILKSTNSMVFDIMLSSVTELLKESHNATLSSGGVERARILHQEIYEALAAHDPDLAEAKMQLHMQYAEEDLLASQAASESATRE